MEHNAKSGTSCAPETRDYGWQCDDCGGRGFVYIDERQADGTYAPGKSKRCVECKKTHAPDLDQV